MDIAKSAVVITHTPDTTRPAEGLPTYDYDGIPIDILRFFNSSLVELETKEKDELNTITKWVFRDVETLGDGLKKLRDLEIRLGRPLGDPNQDRNRRMKIHTWVRMQEQVEELKKRQEAMRV